MDAVTILLVGVVAVVGLLVGFVLGRRSSPGSTRAEALAEERERRVRQLESELEERGSRADGLSRDVSRLETELAQEKKSLEEMRARFEQASKELREAFDSLASEALAKNNRRFLDLASQHFETLRKEAAGDLGKRHQAIEGLVSPIKDSLEKVGKQISEIEKAREGAYGALRQQVQGLADAQETLRGETSKLVRALRAPHGRGQWGEMQLRRVVEMAGMVSHCDFIEQSTVGEGADRSRPDLVVRLPGGKSIVVDSKVPLDAYLEAVEAADEDKRQAALAAHAKHVRDRMRELGSKSYWSRFESSPDFVVMFLPGETVFQAALQNDPSLIEFGVDQQVLPASPVTLIALLRAVAYGWQQERMAENAVEVSRLGRELYDRLQTFVDAFEGVGKGLSSAVGSYNRAVGSFQSRLLPAARRFPELGSGSSQEISDLKTVDEQPREPRRDG